MTGSDPPGPGLEGWKNLGKRRGYFRKRTGEQSRHRTRAYCNDGGGRRGALACGRRSEFGAAEHLAFEHLKSYVESAGVIMVPRCNHGLGRWLERHDGAEEKWPVLGRHEQAAAWLPVWTDLGRAARTIDAYARGLAEYLLVCEREGVDPVAANRAHVAVFVRELTSRPQSARARTWCRSTRGRGWRTRRSSSGWCRSGCSTTSSWRRGCASPTRSAGVGTPPAAGAAGSSAAWCRG